MNDAAAPPRAPLDKLPPELRHDLGSVLEGLSHSALYHLEDDRFGGQEPEYNLPIATEEFAPEQQQSADLATRQLEQAADFIERAYVRLETEGGDRISRFDIVEEAIWQTIDEAESAKQAGQTDKAKSAMESAIILTSVADLIHRHDTSDRWMVRNVVEKGLAADLVAAAHDVRGIVYVRGDSEDWEQDGGVTVGQPIRLLRQHLPILQLASDKYFDETFDRIEPLMPPGQPADALEYRQQLLDELNSRETMMLAQLTLDQKHNPDAAAGLATSAVEKMAKEGARYSYDFTENAGRGTADTLIAAAAICKAADTTSSEKARTVELQKTFAALRHRRHVGSQYRINDDMTRVLDEALVQLVADDQIEIAKALVSSATRELDAAKIRSDLGLNLERTGQIGEIIQKLSNEKLHALAATLQRRGLGDMGIGTVLNFADPDIATDFDDATFARLTSFEGRFSADIINDERLRPHVANPNIAIPEGLLSVPLLRNSFTETIARCADDKKEAFVKAAVQLYRQFEAETEGYIEVSQNYQTALQHALRFKDPIKAWETMGRIYGERAMEKAQAFANSVDQHKLPSEDELTSLIHLQQELQGVFDVDEVVHTFSANSIGKWMEADIPQFLEAIAKLTALDRLEAAYFKSTFLSLNRNGVAIDERSRAINDAGPEFMQVLETMKNIGSFDSIISNIVYGQAGERSAEEQAALRDRITRLYATGFEDLLNESPMPKEKVRLLTEKLIRFMDGPKLAAHLKPALEIFGEFTTFEGLATVSDLIAGDEVPAPLRTLGINRTGEAGLSQLKATLNKLRDGIFENGEVPVDALIKHPFLRDYFKRLTRYEESDWGSHKDDALQVLLTNCERVGATLGKEYAPGEYEIATIDQAKRQAFEISEDGVNEWTAYRKIVNRAEEIVPGDGSVNWGKLSQLLLDIQLAINARGDQMSGGIEKMRVKIADLEAKAKDTTVLTSQIERQQGIRDRLAGIRYDVVEDFDVGKLAEQIAELSTHNSISNTGLLQTLLVTAALVKAEQEDIQVPVSVSLAEGDPDLESIQEMTDFIGHITNQETWRDLFATVGGRKQLDALLSIEALEANIGRANAIATAGTQTFRFIPTRGPLMELSGHIGDICWASKYESIADRFPNMTAIIMVQNADTSSRRLAGAALLIETMSATGEPLLVMRGMNPIQNAMTQLSPESFFTQLSAYAGSIAQATGRKLAVVIDNKSGEAATNRPTLFEFLKGLRPGLTKVPLMSEADTTINGYDIVNHTYLV